MNQSEFSLAESVWPDGATVVAVRGELDLDTAGELKSVLDRLAVAKPRTVLDLSDVSFVDSTGLRVILNAVRHAASDGWSLALAPKVSDSVARLLEITEVYALLPFDGEL